ncbi:hypothetical protein AMTRI_Chr12g241740 [Amborella trichopoda]
MGPLPMLLPLLYSIDMLSLVDGIFVPSKENIESKRDQLLLSWLHATLNPIIFAQAFERAFTSQTNARFYQVRHMEKIKALADELAAIHHAVSQKDLIFCTLDGLGIDYDSLIILVTTSPELPSFEALYNMFLNPRGRGNRARGRGPRGGRADSSRWFYTYPSRMLIYYCQICNKIGYNALHCRQRHNFTYQPKDLPTASFVVNLSTYPYDFTWYPDTSATNHITANSTSIMHPSPYNGQEHIVVANGNTLPINSNGTTYLHTRSSNFLLRDTLHFTKDNNCKFIFCRCRFCIKDRRTRKILHEGPTQNELFPIKVATNVKHHNFVGFVQRNSTIDI